MPYSGSTIPLLELVIWGDCGHPVFEGGGGVSLYLRIAITL